jgi:hypothetical protein
MSDQNQRFADVTHNDHVVTTRKQPDGSYETTFYINGRYAAVHITCAPSARRPAEIIEKDASEIHAYYTCRALETDQEIDQPDKNREKDTFVRECCDANVYQLRVRIYHWKQYLSAVWTSRQTL